MNDFITYNPVRILFGKNSIEQIAKFIPSGAKVFCIYGGGSVKKNGVYDRVNKALENFTVNEFFGIEPNPESETCLKAIEQIKQTNSDFILAIGGGSVIDATKFISAGVFIENEDPFDSILIKRNPIKKAMAFGCVLTIPATASEMNTNAVISRRNTGDKEAFSSEKVYPVFSALDPSVTFTLPEKQTVNGITDTFIHVMEQYMTYNVNAPLQDRQSEAILNTLIEIAPTLINNPNDYDARASMLWCASWGLNHYISAGVPQDWATHMIGHELTALYGLDHARSLAIVMPNLLLYKLKDKQEKLAQMAKRVFALQGDNEEDLAKACIEKIREFFKSIKMPTALSDVNVDANEAATKISEKAKQRNIALGEKADIKAEQIYDILMLAK